MPSRFELIGKTNATITAIEILSLKMGQTDVQPAVCLSLKVPLRNEKLNMLDATLLPFLYEKDGPASPNTNTLNGIEPVSDLPDLTAAARGCRGYSDEVDPVNGPLKSAHAALLNRLSEMQAAPYYATARDTLAQAERVIVQLEAITTAPRGTDAQILKERELTEAAISGAMAFGEQAAYPPPDDSHWLAPWWKKGRELGRAFEIADSQMMTALTCYGQQLPGERYARCDSTSDEFTEAVEWLLPRGYIERDAAASGEVFKVLRLPEAK